MSQRYRLRIARPAVRALTEQLPEQAAAAYEFITGPLLDDPHRVGRPPDPPLAPGRPDAGPAASCTSSTTTSESSKSPRSDTAGWDGWPCHLYRLAVRPDRRRQGIARALLRVADQRAAFLGARRMDAMVLDDNEPGRQVWSAAGYVRQAVSSRWVERLPPGPANR